MKYHIVELSAAIRKKLIDCVMLADLDSYGQRLDNLWKYSDNERSIVAQATDEELIKFVEDILTWCKEEQEQKQPPTQVVDID